MNNKKMTFSSFIEELEIEEQAVECAVDPEADINDKYNKKIKGKIKKAAETPNIKVLGKFGEALEENNKEYKSLVRKSNNSGIDIDVIAEVYNRGCDTWSPDNTSLTETQYAFSRVNSFISRGSNYYNEDADLVTEEIKSLYSVSKQDIINNKFMEHDKCGTPECCGQCVDEALGPDNMIGTDGLVRKYKSETPGQENAETENVGKKDVVVAKEQKPISEAIRSSNYKLIKIRMPEGNYVWRKVRRLVKGDDWNLQQDSGEDKRRDNTVVVKVKDRNQ